MTAERGMTSQSRRRVRSRAWLWTLNCNLLNVLTFLAVLHHGSMHRGAATANNTAPVTSPGGGDVTTQAAELYPPSEATATNTTILQQAPTEKQNSTRRHKTNHTPKGAPPALTVHKTHPPNIPETHVLPGNLTRGVHLFSSSTKHRGPHSHQGRGPQEAPLAAAGITNNQEYDKHHFFRPDKMYHRAQYPSSHFERHLKVPGMVGKAEAHMNFREDPEDFDGSNDTAAVRLKSKYYNYKLLYDTIQRREALSKRQTSFYAWIFGSAMLALGSFTALVSCLGFCFCTEKWKKRRRQRKLDKMGIYQRVDSVSSMVSTMSERSRNMDDYEPIESTSVTII